jgi:hypothetical protein
MKAFLIDAGSRTIEEIDFDGDERKIAELLGSNDIQYEQWPISGSHTIGGSLVTRIYCDSKAVDNSSMQGFQIPETCGIVNHGLCLQVAYLTGSRKFVDCKIDVATIKRTYRIYEPNSGMNSGAHWK